MKVFKLEKIDPKSKPQNISKGLIQVLLHQLGEIPELISKLFKLSRLIYDETKVKKVNDWIIFDFKNNVISIESNNNIEEIKFNIIQSLKINYYQDLHNIPPKKEPPKIEITQGNNTKVIYFNSSHYTLSLLIKKLYETSIKPKEYIDGQRAYLGKRRTFSEIQEIKERYKLEGGDKH